MRAALNNLSIIQHMDYVGVAYSAKAVRDNNGCAPAAGILKRLLDE